MRAAARRSGRRQTVGRADMALSGLDDDDDAGGEGSSFRVDCLSLDDLAFAVAGLDEDGAMAGKARARRSDVSGSEGSSGPAGAISPANGDEDTLSGCDEGGRQMVASVRARDDPCATSDIPSRDTRRRRPRWPALF